MKNKPKYLREEQERFNCPCCHKDVAREHVSRALDTPLPEWGYYRKSSPDVLKISYVQWACNNCLSAKKAIAGVPPKQMYGMDFPFLAYFDRKETCRNCKQQFVFSATEQQYWYETLKFWVQSVPVRCASCRKTLRQGRNLNTQLSKLLEHGEPEDVETLLRVAALYRATGKEEKTKAYERKAEKLKKKTIG